MSFSISVIISTYDCPQRLDLVLLGFDRQSYKNFQIVVADYGATEETLLMLENFRKLSSMDIAHISDDNDSFQNPLY